MRLNVTSTSNVHKELVACVGWNAFNELYSVGDDKTVSRWDINGVSAFAALIVYQLTD